MYECKEREWPFFLNIKNHFLKIFRDEREELVVINVHLAGFGYFQYLVSLRRISFGEIHPKQYFFVILFISFCCIYFSHGT